MARWARRYTPRDVRAFGAAIFAMGLYCIGLGMFASHRNWQFENQSREARGSVERLYWSSGRSGGPRVAYTYLVGPVGVSTECPVLATTWNDLRVGESIPVKFLISFPEINRIDLAAENQSWSNFPRTSFWMAILFLGVGGYIFYRYRNCHA